MAKMLMLRWKPINTGNGIWFDSNLIVLNGTSGVHIESKKSNLDVTTFQSMTGGKFVTCFQDYFGEVWDKIIPHPGIGQVIKFRYRDWETDRKSTRLNSSHSAKSRMPSSA